MAWWPRAWPPIWSCSTPTRSPPDPLRRIHDFPADGERLTADAPVGVTHTLVNGVPIRLDGEQVDTSERRPGVVLR